MEPELGNWHKRVGACLVVSALFNAGWVLLVGFFVYINYWSGSYMPNFMYHSFYPATLAAAVVCDAAYRHWQEKRAKVDGWEEGPKLLWCNGILLGVMTVFALVIAIWFTQFSPNYTEYSISTTFAGTTAFGSNLIRNTTTDESATGQAMYLGVFALGMLVFGQCLWNFLLTIVLFMAKSQPYMLIPGSRNVGGKEEQDGGYLNLLKVYQGYGYHFSRQRVSNRFFMGGWRKDGLRGVALAQLVGYGILVAALIQTGLGLSAISQQQQLWIPVQAPWVFVVFFSWWLVNPPMPKVSPHVRHILRLPASGEEGVEVGFNNPQFDNKGSGEVVGDDEAPKMEGGMDMEPVGDMYSKTATVVAKEQLRDEDERERKQATVHRRVELKIAQRYLYLFYTPDDELQSSELRDVGKLKTMYVLGEVPGFQYLQLFGLIVGIGLQLSMWIPWLAARGEKGVGGVCAGNWRAFLTMGGGIAWLGGFNETYYPAQSNPAVADTLNNFGTLQCWEDALDMLVLGLAVLGVCLLIYRIWWGNRLAAFRNIGRTTDNWHNLDELKKHPDEHTLYRYMYQPMRAKHELEDEQHKNELRREVQGV